MVASSPTPTAALAQLDPAEHPPERLRVLLVVHECNPDWTSVPLVGYQYYRTLKQLADVTLVTHGRNRQALSRCHPQDDIHYLDEGRFSQAYYRRFVDPVTTLTGDTLWQLLAILIYPIYAEFNHQVYARFGDRIAAGEFDIVHAITPMMPRYPVKISQVCQRHGVPFVLGPVNGGLPYPDGFRDVAVKEFAYFSGFRTLGRYLIPDYRQTYRRASHILVGSSYTLGVLRRLFELEPERASLFFENGVNRRFAELPPRLSRPGPVRLLFVGRLVPLKGADMLLSAIAALPSEIRQQVQLSIVGDGAERPSLEQQTQRLGLQNQVEFAGWVQQANILDHYARADIFCFPSIRDFGGAVVMEAMAAGLPCIAVNHGGISEYITDETGYRIDPISRDYVIRHLALHLSRLVSDPALRSTLSAKAQQRAQQFVWETKAQQIVGLYNSLLEDAPALTAA